MSKVKHEKGEFQLEFPDGTPGSVKMLAGGALKWLNDLDTNNDGKSDVAQLGPKFQQALPFLIEVSKLMDWDKVIAWAIQQFAKDKPAAIAKVAELKAIGEAAANEVKTV